MIESIINFVFNNLFIVIIGIAIVYNLLSSSKRTRNQNEQRQSESSSSGREPQTKDPETIESKIERNLKKFENIFEEEKVSESQPVEKAITSVEEQQQKQRDALANRIQTSTHTDRKDEPEQKTSSNALTVISHHNKKSSISQKGLKKRISKKGLKESIVMAEILGKPRSLKPYSSKRVD